MRRAYTLVELLVVMVIIVILVAVSLPLVKRVMDNDRVRASSRQMQAYIEQAKTTAVTKQRPAGVVLQLATPLGIVDPPLGQPVVRQCTQLYLAEAPPRYAGATQSSKGRILPSATNPGQYEFQIVEFDQMSGNYIVSISETPVLLNLINEGDEFTVQFDHKGAWYRCQRTNGQFFYSGLTTLGSPVPVPPGLNDPLTNPGYAFTIQRAPQPIGDPMELTGGTCLDMSVSGVGPADGSFAMPRQSVAIMFSPQGSVKDIFVDGVRVDPGDPLNRLGSIFFLIGRTYHMGDPSVGTPPAMGVVGQSNLADATSYWIAIARQTGKVTVAQNAPTTTWTDWSLPGRAAYLADARKFAAGGEQANSQD